MGAAGVDAASSAAQGDGRRAGSVRPEAGAAAISDDDWGRVLASIERADVVCLACHVWPDGDALGSMLAFALALRARGKAVVASFGDAFVVPTVLRFLPGLELLSPPADYPAEPDVMVTFDAASLERLGTLAANASKARELIVVDHHASTTRFGSTNLIDPGGAATAVVTETLISRLGVALTKDIALDLYVGLATDTGSFRYAATTPEVHAFAGRLLATGLQPDLIARELWDRAPFGYLQVLAAALGRVRLEPDAAGGLGLVWTTVTRSDREAHGLPYDLVEAVIDVVRRADEAEVAVVFKETDAGSWYVSTRSKGRVDLSQVCAAVGGGGNPGMAAFQWDGTVDEAMNRFRAMLTRAVMA